MKNKYNVLSLFSGIGQFETGFDKAGIDYDLFKYCEFDKKIAKAFSVVHGVPESANLGDITKVDTTALKEELSFLGKEIDIMTYGFVCFEKGSLVRTKDGYKPIEQISAEDEVLTHKNRYCKVLSRMSRYKENILNLNIQGSSMIKSTEEHPFYVRRLVNGKLNTISEWVAAKDLEPGMFVGINVEHGLKNKTLLSSGLEIITPHKVNMCEIVRDFIAENGFTPKVSEQDGLFKINGAGLKRMSVESDGYIWTPFIGKELIKWNDLVYNIEVDTDDTYTVNNLIVHNCKPFSMAGQRLGFEDEKHGDLFFHSMRIAKEIKPKVMIAENVKGLVGHDHGNTLSTIVNTLDHIGYITFHKVLISSDYGVPQARERWYAVSIRKDIYEQLNCTAFEFPEAIPLTKTVADYIIADSKRKPFLSSVAPYITKEHLMFNKYRSNVGIKKVYDGMVQGHATSGFASHRVYSIYGSAPTLVCSNDQQYYEIGGYLTGVERLMLQGLSLDSCKKLVDLGFSDGTLSKMAGNAVTAEVFQHLILQINNYIKPVVGVVCE